MSAKGLLDFDICSAVIPPPAAGGLVSFAFAAGSCAASAGASRNVQTSAIKLFNVREQVIVAFSLENKS
jgi:hypothetical protein